MKDLSDILYDIVTNVKLQQGRYTGQTGQRAETVTFQRQTLKLGEFIQATPIQGIDVIETKIQSMEASEMR